MIMSLPRANPTKSGLIIRFEFPSCPLCSSLRVLCELSNCIARGSQRTQRNSTEDTKGSTGFTKAMLYFCTPPNKSTKFLSSRNEEDRLSVSTMRIFHQLFCAGFIKISEAGLLGRIRHPCLQNFISPEL